MGNVLETTSNFLTSRGGSGMFSRGPDKKRRAEITALEDTMIDKMQDLSLDPITNKPVVTSIVEEEKGLDKKKEDEILGLSSLAKTDTEKRLADLTRRGTTGHGKTAALQRDTGEKFKLDFDKTFKEWTQDKGSLEDRAIETLSGIRQSIQDTKSLYESTDTMESEFPTRKYDVGTLGGEVKPLDVSEEMYEYDYISGKKRK
tara:strand:+ start:1627 stop:2232 length:606 start_codon:yes stop_codon:yes gene_type:complete